MMSQDVPEPDLSPIEGIHHITAITGSAQLNVNFYTGILGLRLVKKTVNFDDPTAYHLYFGDAVGHPGTILTFFAWPDLPHGRRGSGQVTEIAFSVPTRSLGYWSTRLRALGVASEGLANRFGEEGLRLSDPDGLVIELVGRDDDPRQPWEDGPVAAQHAVRGFAYATLTVQRPERTLALLTETMGFHRVDESSGRVRLATLGSGPGAIVDVSVPHEPGLGRIAVGSVHHIAWRVPDTGAQVLWRERIAHQGLHVTSIIDRTYFRSVYFREPGQILFEIATDPPGFTIDEAPEALGTALRLPPWFEDSRARIQAALPPLETGNGHA